MTYSLLLYGLLFKQLLGSATGEMGITTVSPLESFRKIPEQQYGWYKGNLSTSNTWGKWGTGYCNNRINDKIDKVVVKMTLEECASACMDCNEDQQCGPKQVQVNGLRPQGLTFNDCGSFELNGAGRCWIFPADIEEKVKRYECEWEDTDHLDYYELTDIVTVSPLESFRKIPERQYGWYKGTVSTSNTWGPWGTGYCNNRINDKDVAKMTLEECANACMDCNEDQQCGPNQVQVNGLRPEGLTFNDCGSFELNGGGRCWIFPADIEEKVKRNECEWEDKDHLDYYELISHTASPAVSAAPTDSADTSCDAKKPSYIGCYTDDDKRDLFDGPRNWGFNQEGCNKACQAYPYFALQAHGWCVCGAAYATELKYVKRPDDECGSMGLGGPWRNSIYHTCVYQYTSCDAKNPSYIGCYADDVNRDLHDGPRYYGFTQQTCNEACQAYPFFALQMHGWCVCGAAYATEPQYVKKPDAECGSMGLGGPWRNSIYHTCGYEGN